MLLCLPPPCDHITSERGGAGHAHPTPTRLKRKQERLKQLQGCEEGAPAKQFWSITLYANLSHGPLITPKGAADLSSRKPDLVSNSDGSVDVDFGPRRLLVTHPAVAFQAVAIPTAMKPHCQRARHALKPAALAHQARQQCAKTRR
jgi:hypothetical protein